MNVVPAAEYSFLFVQAQASNSVYSITYVWCPVLFIVGILLSSLVLVFFGQTNDSYKRFIVLLVMIFAGSIVLSIIAFMTASANFYGFSALLQALMCGALKLYLFEFMTEITFPVSPCFALAILNSFSGLVSLVLSMLANDLVISDPLNKSFVFIVQIICLITCGISLYYFATFPYKLNRTDYDLARRSTMVTTYMRPSGKPQQPNSNDDFNATSINRLI